MTAVPEQPLAPAAFWPRPRRVGTGLRALLPLLALLLLWACLPAWAGHPVQSATPAALAPMPTVTMVAQRQRFLLEKAINPDQLMRGLMYRHQLAERHGMLFPFTPPQPVSFWMKNTLIPLDMIFIRNGVIETVHQNVPPCKQDPCAMYPSRVPIDSVVELPAGSVRRYGLTVGQSVRFEGAATAQAPGSPAR